MKIPASGRTQNVAHIPSQGFQMQDNSQVRFICAWKMSSWPKVKSYTPTNFIFAKLASETCQMVSYMIRKTLVHINKKAACTWWLSKRFTIEMCCTYWKSWCSLNGSCTCRDSRETWRCTVFKGVTYMKEIPCNLRKTVFGCAPLRYLSSYAPRNNSQISSFHKQHITCTAQTLYQQQCK